MNIKDLRIFIAAATMPSLTNVAGALGMAAGTVSKRIQSLENDLGVRLLDRNTRSSRLTEEGRMFLQRAERILAEVDQAMAEIAANTGRPAGRITVTAPASLANRLVNPAILGFMKACPEVEVRVDVTDTVVNLHEQGYDAAIRFGSLPDSTLKAKRLAADRRVLVAAPSYIQSRGTPQKPSELAGHDCLIHGEQRTWAMHQGDARTSVRVSGRLVSDSGDFLRTAALQGAGILRTSEIAVLDDLAKGSLVQVLPGYNFGTDAGIWAVYPSSKHAMPRLRALLDHMTGYCRQHLGSEAAESRPGLAARSRNS